MSTPVIKAGLSLRSFFIFNSRFGPKEGEEEKKILFYHPQEADLDSKIKDVGLCEAIIKFSNTFTNDDSVQAMHTQKTSQLYYQPEPGYWMIMILNVPFLRKTRETGDYNEYHGDDVHDTIYQAVLKQSYRMFRLFHGTFESNLKPGDDLDALANLIGILEQFYFKYILHLKLKDCDVLDAFGSVQYLPLNQLLFLRVQNFINMIEATFEPIRQCIFLYEDQIVWSGINPNDLYTIYEYLNGPMFQMTSGQDRSRKVYIEETGQTKVLNFMVCRKVQNITLCLFLEEVENEQALYHELNAVINPQLTSISSDISQHLTQQASSENGTKDDASSTPKFIYFNELNLHYRGTVKLGTQKRNHTLGSLPNDVMNLIVDLLDDAKGSIKKGTEETILKTHDDYWIVKRSCNSRYVFIVLNKNSTLIDVSDETKRILEQNMKGVFF